jgi:hypothetical protein
MYDKIYLERGGLTKTKKTNFVVDQYDDPTHDATEDLILLASLYPGVTRTVAEFARDVDPLDSGRQVELMNWARQQGMGLYALTRTALDLHQGVLTIRSGRNKLMIEIARDKYRKGGARYRATITNFPRTFPRFKGNLLTIQLPISSE